MGKTYLIRLAFICAAALLVFLDFKWLRKFSPGISVSKLVLTMLAFANILFVVFLFFNHARFPLNLEISEGTILQSFQKAVEFNPLYPEPSPEYVPFAYNPFYYVLAIPFSYLFGVGLFTLRFVSIIGTILSALIICHVVRKKAGSLWWGLLALGLFAAAYHTMDNYLDVAHPDTWMLGTVLLGSYLIDRNYSRFWNLMGIVILTISFWFKQHGAFFALGALFFLTWREGFRHSLLYWGAALILGPFAYVFLGPPLFGSHFLYFTWGVPRRWSEINLSTVHFYFEFVAKRYPVLALSAGIVTLGAIFKGKKTLELWHIALISAAVASFAGALDPGGSYNNFIPMGALLILVGLLGIHTLEKRGTLRWHKELCAFALFISFGALIYKPFIVVVPRDANMQYQDLLQTLIKLEGNAYAPSIGHLQDGYKLYPSAHWSALEDMIRGPGQDTRNHPITRRLLAPAIQPKGPAFILANEPLTAQPWMAFLEDYYVLDSDFGDRFKSLRVLPVRYDHKWPRYLYRYEPRSLPARARDSQ